MRLGIFASDADLGMESRRCLAASAFNVKADCKSLMEPRPKARTLNPMVFACADLDDKLAHCHQNSCSCHFTLPK